MASEAGSLIRRTSQGRSARFSMLVLLGLLLFATTLQVAHVKRFQKLSPIDELQHLDYLLRAPSLDFPGSGDRVLREAAVIETCSRIESPFDDFVPPCVTDPQAPFDVTLLQEAGFNTAYIHPPGYYVVDGVVTRASETFLGGSLGVLTLARLAGLVWVWAAVVFLWLAFKEFDASDLIAAVGTVLIVTAPTFLSAVSTVNPDGSAVAVGAAALWAAARWDRKRSGAWMLPVIGVIAVMTKFSNLAGVAIALLFLTVPAIRSSLRRIKESGFRSLTTVSDDRQRLVVVGISGLAIAIASIALRIGQFVLQVVPPNDLPMAAPTITDRVPMAAIAASWRVGLSPLQQSWFAAFMQTSLVRTMIPLVDLAVVAGAVLAGTFSAVGTRARRLAWCALGVAVAFGPVFALFLFFAQGVNISIPPRYGLSMVPALVVAAIPLLRTRVGLALASLLALFATIAAVGALAYPVTA